MALKHISLKPEGALTTAKEVAESYQAPFDATARVLQIMASRGWLKSEQGAFGGYKLTRRLSEVTLLDLIQVIEGTPKIAKCLHQKSDCEIQSSCNIVSPIQTLNQRLNQFYQSFSLAELLLNEPADTKGLRKYRIQVWLCHRYRSGRGPEGLE
jgi:Rrf2 family protein